MMKMTYGRLVGIGAVCAFSGFALAMLTGWDWFSNLGWIIYGMIVILFPAYPPSAASNPHIKTYVRFVGVLLIIVGCMISYGPERDAVSRAIGVDARKGKVIDFYDDHGGFHGDGATFEAMRFEDDKILSDIRQNPDWKSLPLTDSLNILVYGEKTENMSRGPYLAREGETFFPEITNGYYYFYDRQGETMEDTLVLTRGSFNVTVAIFDMDTNTLYYCKFDT